MKYLILIFIPVWFGCGEDQEVTKPKETVKDWSMGHSVDYNQEVSAREELDIKIYLEHHKGLKMTTSNSTLRHQIIRSKLQNRKSADEGDLVHVKVKISLLNGAVCYESDSIPDQFVIGKSDVASTGLQEGIQLMYESDKAKFIVPSGLAYGLLGDESLNIPPQAVLIYDVELITVEK